MLAVGTVLDIGDHSVEVTRTPEQTGDRYGLHIEAEPGGPGITGDFPHRHPVLVESFICRRGQMLVKVGRTVRELPVGERIDVPVDAVHGFLNTGTETLVIDSEVVFVRGYDPADDLMLFAAAYDRMRRDGPVRTRTGEPPLLQLAALTHTYRRAIVQPPPAGLLIPALAGLARVLGRRPPGPS